MGRIRSQHPELTTVLDWLEREGIDAAAIATAATKSLRTTGRELPQAQLKKYQQRVLAGQFIAAWLKKHEGHTVKSVLESDRAGHSEWAPFELALIVVSDEMAFKRVSRRMARQSMARATNMDLGTPDGFSAFVASHTKRLGALLLKNFDHTRKDAAFKAVPYFHTVAVSQYLTRTRPIQPGKSNLKEYLQQSARLDVRTRLATKIAYLPALLTSDERAILRDRFGLKGGFAMRMPIKDIAKKLKFKDAASLSRKLYRVRKWCDNSRPAPRRKEKK